MIVSSMKLEFSAASWAVPGKSSERVRRMFERVIGRNDGKVVEERAMEQMSLAELLYHVLVDAKTGTR